MTSRSHDSQRGRAWCPGLPRGRRTLSGTPRPDAQVHHTAGTAAPSVHVSHQQAAHRTTSAGTKRGKEEEELDHRGDRAGETHEPRGESEPRVRSALYSVGLCPSQRGAPPVAPPRSWLHLPSRSFEKPLEGGRALTPTASRRASTNQKRAALTPSIHTKRGENRREKTPQAP